MRTTILSVFALLLVMAGMVGCKDADWAQFASSGSKHKVTVYDYQGHYVDGWESTGNVSESSETHAWYFENAANHKLVEVSGGIIIVEQE